MAFAPMLDVMLHHRRGIRERAYVDSGASTTYVPRLTAERTGLLDDSPGMKVDAVGVSGTIDANEHNIRSIAIMRNDEVFDRFDNSKILVPSDYDAGPNFVIMGRDLLFSRYDITFSERRRKLTLEKS